MNGDTGVRRGLGVRGLTVAALAGVGTALVLWSGGDSLSPSASAKAAAPPNAAEQRLQMIRAIERLESQMARVEGAVDRLSGSTLKVEVVRFPDVQAKD